LITDPRGNAWYAALTGHRVAKIDSNSSRITEYPPPTNMIAEQGELQLIAKESFGLLSITPLR
jgi:streptogramin lyase